MKLLQISAMITACMAAASAFAAPENFMGRWALDLNGGAGWFEFSPQQGWIAGSVLWGGGSVLPLDNVYFEGDTLCATRTRSIEHKDVTPPRRQIITDILKVTVNGDELKGSLTSPNPDGVHIAVTEFTGKRIPPVGPAPDLSKVKFGDTIELFNGKNLDGWKLTDANAVNGWSAEDGILTNVPKKEPGKGAGNLRTEKEFEDFNLTCEVNVPEKGNSGVYLRGIYEVQVEDSHGKPLDPHNMGAIYSRITPTESAEKPAGEWQKLDMTLVDRHVTVKLNGKTIIDNQPLAGCTGGAMWADEFKPGPIYLQGDHTAIKYRNIKLKPVIK